MNNNPSENSSFPHVQIGFPQCVSYFGRHGLAFFAPGRVSMGSAWGEHVFCDERLFCYRKLAAWPIRSTSGSPASRSALEEILPASIFAPSTSLLLRLLIAAVLAIPPVRQSLAWHLSFPTNLYIIKKGDWQPYISHLWYLAAQEQVYLFGPSVILFTPRTYLLPVVLLTIGLGPFIRLLMVDIDKFAFFDLPAGYLDLLGTGALLALLVHLRGVNKLPRWLASLWVEGALVTVMVLIHFGILTEAQRLVIGTVPMTLFSGWFLASAIQARSRLLSGFLEIRPLVYLGRISYSVYIWHIFLIYILSASFSRIGFSQPDSPLLRSTLLVTCSITVGDFSWY